jgi:hypothetical protein
LQAIEESRPTHEQIIQSGCKADVFVGSSLVDMYAKCGSMEDAHRVLNKEKESQNVHLECNDFGTCEMWTSTEGTETISTNATGRCVARL